MIYVAPYRVVRGPLAGYNVGAKVWKSPRGVWMSEVNAVPWGLRAADSSRSWTRVYTDPAVMATELCEFLDTCEEMSQGPIVEPVTAY